MIVAIQQPEHTPWMGFFHKMANCDLFVYLDSVQFKKRYFENRNRIKTSQGQGWITVPVLSKGRFHQRIDTVPIDAGRPWMHKYQGALEHAYSRAPFWKDVKEIVWPCLENAPTDLVSLNLTLIDRIRAYLSIDVETMRSSTMELGDITGKDLILAICRKVGAQTYLSGPDGRRYLDASDFAANGIDLRYHDYEHPSYTQMRGRFVSHMSTLDLIANQGPASGDFIRGLHPEEVVS